jgi:Na+-driven multidrug efflux pump
VFSVIFLPAIAVARGVETMTGQNIGAGHLDRAKAANDFAARAMFLILSVAAVVVFAVAPAVVDIFATSQAVIGEGANFLRLVAPTFGFIGIMRAYTGGFRGAGKTMTAAAISVLMVGIVRVPSAWVGAVRFGTTGLWASFFVSNVVGATVAYLWFRRGTWRDADVTDAPSGTNETSVEADADAAVDD